MYNNYASEHAFWADTTNMDNLRGADATGKATPGSFEVSSTADSVTGFGNTRHSYSGDEIHAGKCRDNLGTIASHSYIQKGSKCDNGVDTSNTWIFIDADGSVQRITYSEDDKRWETDNGNDPSGFASLSSTCDIFNFQSKGVGKLSSNGIIKYDPTDNSLTIYGADGTTAQDVTFSQCY